ncbi:putative uncharacterized protein DDB_G0272516 [Condylostylus longicornis]|uniref:putative uncharacterized protein DDB_G0272516 n=1 Tax=Condylostylus longicornis TaxID=2530218 RepID=UPI00244E2087|nr:putative uncharacterized protein DDB_G0272516 [Condylostylus longicornis]
MITIFSFFALLTLSVAVPQYPPSGWRPRGTPFVLPREYLPSAPLKAAAQHEINRERLEYIGQYQVREPIFGHRANIEQPEPQLQNEFQFQSQQPQPQLQQSQQPQQPQYQPPPKPHATYLTPSPDIPTTTEQYVDDFSTTTEYFTTTTATPNEENFLKVQGLPSLNKPAQFRNLNKVMPLSTNTFSQQQNSNTKSGQFRQQEFQPERSVTQQSRQQQGLKEQVALVSTETGKSGKQAVDPVSNTYGAPESEIPANTYGVPQIAKQPDNEVSNSKLPTNENNSGSNESTEDSNEQQTTDNLQGNVAISNSINRNGQYYILSPDNMLQRVLFMTTPNKGDTGFTAQLRYMPVEPIRDPIYAYNENGQLIRIFRK